MLSYDELLDLTENCVDPHPVNAVVRGDMNAGLTDEELVEKIISRNNSGKPTYLLRLEYRKRLEQRQKHG